MKHNHYFKQVPAGATHIDVYRVLIMFNVTNPCLQHAVKKLLVAGGRGAGKDITQDIKEAIDSLVRWQEMRQEDSVVGNGVSNIDPNVLAESTGTQPQQWAQGPHGE